MNIPTATCFLFTFLWLFGYTTLVHSQGAPKFIGRPKKKYNASERSSVRLRCPVTGTNDPHNRTLVAWTRNSKHISNTNPVWSRFRVKVGRYLKIVNISRQDAGVYTCKAFNEFGSIMLKIRLSVYDRKNEGKTGGEPPRFKGRPPRDLDFKTGETAKLRCHSTGNPDPEVQWYKDGQSYTKNKRQSVSANGWTLNLRYLTKRDSGTYLCRVSNKLGTITRTFIVKVKARIPKPRIVNTEHNVSVHQGKNATLDCRATSTGKPVFTWRRWGNTFNKFNRSKKIRVSKKISTKYVIYEIKHNEMDMFGTSLVIINATKEDEGNYTCVVKNKYGSDEMVKFLFVLMRGDGPGLITTTLRPTPGKSQDAEKKDSFALVIGLTASTVVTIALIVLSILCCRKQRKNLEEQYVRACKPVSLLQPQQKICVSREMQKPSCQEHVPPRDSSWHKSYSEPSDNTSRTFHDNYDRLDEGVTSSNETQRPKYGLQADNYPEQRTERRSSNPDYSNAVDSRTSSETTIATETSGSREPFIDFKKSTNSIPDCRPAESHSNYGGINSYKDHRNSSGSENQFVRETVM